MKDNFSTKSADYAKFRPTYPKELYQFIKKNLDITNSAWDCGTGNGQVARELAKFFTRVEATDISAQQLENALQKPNINYSRQPAEETNFPDNSFNLVTVAQAIHWFNFDAFYAEVNRVLKPGGFIAVIGYSLFKSNAKTDAVITSFYKDIIGPWWDEERRYLDEHYKNLAFPFNELQTPDFQKEYEWTFEQLIGYLKTWSAVKHYKNAKGDNPVELIKTELKTAFGEKNKVVFPILFRMGRKEH